MTEKNIKAFVCDLLDSLRASCDWLDSVESILNALGVNCKAIEVDPLYSFNLHVLSSYIQDWDLVHWWLESDEDDVLFVDPWTGEEYEVLEAADLYELDQTRRKNKR